MVSPYSRCRMLTVRPTAAPEVVIGTPLLTSAHWPARFCPRQPIRNLPPPPSRPRNPHHTVWPHSWDFRLSTATCACPSGGRRKHGYLVTYVGRSSIDRPFSNDTCAHTLVSPLSGSYKNKCHRMKATNDIHIYWYFPNEFWE